MAALPPTAPATGIALGPGFALACDALEASGLVVEPQPDGVLQVLAQRIVARGVRVRSPQVTLDIAEATLTGVRARIAPGPAAPLLLELAAQEIAVANLDAALPRTATSASAPAAPVRLDALADLEGRLHAFITDALWFIDADVTVPIDRGTIDFNAVEVAHVGPDSALAISSSGIHVLTPGQRQMELVSFGGGPPPGVRSGTQGHFPFQAGDRGRLDLLPFLQALLQAPRGKPLAQPADAALSGALERTRVTGELRLGDGVLARGAQQVELAGRATGKNRVTLDSPALAQRVVLGIPELHASSAALALPGRVLRAATLTAVVEAHLLGPDAPAASPRVVLAVAQATLREVTLAPPA